jgi:hypothetical protein
LDFSIVIPSRGNLSGLKHCLTKFFDLTKNLDKVEFLLVLDTDDPDLEKIFTFVNTMAMRIKCYVRSRSEYHGRDYVNWGMNKATGENLWVFNDDAYVQTLYWDDLIKDAIGSRKVYMVDTWCSDHEDIHSFPRFPLVSREAYNAVGFFFFPEVRMWGADAVLFDMYKQADAVIPCHGVRVQHDHVPSKRFWDIYEQDKKNGVFPVPALDELIRLKEARRTLDIL